MSLRSRVRALEKLQAPTTLAVGSPYTLPDLDGVYEPRWIRERYGVVDPVSEQIDREWGDEQCGR